MKRDNIFIAIMVATIILAIFVLGVMTEKITNQRTKYEYYLNGEKGYSYHCESDKENGARCSIDGNLIQVDQFSDETK